MLGDSEVVATIAVTKMQRATDFYVNVLGLEIQEEVPGGTTLRSGNGRIFIYPSEFAGTNKATAASWMHKDIEGLVKDLQQKGVTLEEYDNLPEAKREGPIHYWGEMKAVWFKDPDGNILNVTNMM